MEIGEWQGIKINKTYSWKIFYYGKLDDGTLIGKLKPEEFPSEYAIVGTNFSMYEPEQSIFPDGVKDLVFINCNLDNLLLPVGSKYCENSCNYQYKEQPNGENWVVEVKEDKGEKSYTPICILNTPEAVEHWKGKRKEPIDIETLKISEELI